MMNVKTDQETNQSALLANYARAPVTFVRGEGCELIDANGNRYLDFVAGIAVCSLGHAHPRITEAIATQAATLVHCSNLYFHEPAGTLAYELVTRSGFERAFFCNSGAEANEAAIKLARKWAYRQGQTKRRTILSCTDSFHGRTMGALTATANPKYHEGFDPLPLGFRVTTFNDLADLEAKLDDEVAAVLLEPVQGESGVWPADVRYLQRARELCDERGALLIFDEIQCGIGRIGPLFAFEHFGVRPDAITLAKALANGLPIGAMLMNARCASVLQPGDHGTTFGGSPVPCAAALEHLKIRDDIRLEQHVQEIGGYFFERLQQLHADFPRHYGAPRGLGLMLGLTVQEPYLAAEIAALARGESVLLNGAGHNSLRFVPPLIITKSHVDTVIAVLAKIAGMM